MSCDWHIYCTDCGSTHAFDDANHEDKLMLALIQNAEKIAALASIELVHDVGVSTSYGRASSKWFAEHLGHRLVAKSEYGDVKVVDGYCGEVAPVRVGHDIMTCIATHGHTGRHYTQMRDVHCSWDADGFKATRDPE